MHHYDIIRFLHFPTPIVDICRDVIKQTWTRAIKNESEYGGSHEFKLHGFPWGGSGGQTTEARRTICRLLEALHGQGWVLMISTSISKKEMEKDTLLFRHQTPAPAPCDWAAIGFSKNDRIRFIDAPPEIADSLAARLGSHWVKERTLIGPGVHEFKLDGSPWWANGTKVMEVREMLLTFLEVLESEGWTVYASVDQKDGGQNYTETDTWHCCRLKSWTQGAPVYHG
ncbi:hypothetical protein B0J11DRAFT_433796 [Dendryphion nanum]|uniref:Uncharacterized protein n=1 Tax=Dendryphion nanum TaxID=256645 RepID=A0A9P9DUN1_9PLEO|nr:hypothetical protein B0J11DRAFT_433796 [Dendryphion nanum]